MVTDKAGIFEALHNLVRKASRDLLVRVAFRGFVVEWYLVHLGGLVVDSLISRVNVVRMELELALTFYKG